jgi:hypothetical protein
MGYNAKKLTLFALLYVEKDNLVWSDEISFLGAQVQPLDRWFYIGQLKHLPKDVDLDARIRGER